MQKLEIRMGRPENQMPPECFYDDKEAVKYTNCTRIIKVQSEMAERCLDLIGIYEITEDEEPKFVLDLGCGSGLSGELIDERGHMWWGLDISESMLKIAKEREVEGELMYGDIGEGFNIQAGFFDAVISVSALQWLCYSEKKIHNPWKRLIKLFQSVQKSLKVGGKAAIQFYPENSEQIEMISNAAIKAGLTGGIYIDYPNSAQAKKFYLVLSTACEGKMGVKILNGLEQENESKCEKEKNQKKKRIKKRDKFDFKSKYWVYEKKERQRKQGKTVRVDTKYTGRKRKVYF